jgi:hypothetical protein
LTKLKSLNYPFLFFKLKIITNPKMVGHHSPIKIALRGSFRNTK